MFNKKDKEPIPEGDEDEDDEVNSQDVRYDPDSLSFHVGVEEEFLEEYHTDLESYQSQQRKTRMRKIIGVVVVSLVMATAIVGVTLGMKRVKDDSRKAVTALSSPHQGIHEVCDVENISTLEGRVACEELCKESLCCLVPVGTEGSCLETDTETCAEYYAPCKAIYEDGGGNQTDSTVAKSPEAPGKVGSTTDVPPAPHNLVDVCSSTSLAVIEGFTECQYVCLRAECCTATSKAENCREANRETCKEYAPCNILTMGNGDPRTADEACQSENIQTVLGMQQCIDACAVARCCFPDQIGHNGETCVTKKNTQWCEKFASCGVLSLTDSSEEVVEILSQEGVQALTAQANGGLSNEDMVVLVQEACTQEAISTNPGRKACADLCKKRECCFSHSPNNCHHDEKDWCAEFEPCQVLSFSDDLEHHEHHEEEEEEEENGDEEPIQISNIHNESMNLDNKTLSVSIACTEEHVSTKQGRKDCREQCSPGKCCFTDGEGSCPDMVKWCKEFSGCEILGEGFAEKNDLPQHVLTECLFQNIQTEEGRAECKETCLQRKCCFMEGEGSCGDMVEYCEAFEICNSLGDELLNEDEIEYDEGDAKEMMPHPVLSDCSEENVSTNEGLEKCKDTCSERKCCFHEGDGSCKEMIDWCGEFVSCEILGPGAFDDEDDASPSIIDTEADMPHQVLSDCFEDSVATVEGRMKCKKTCSERECCFKEEGNCSTERAEWCDEYAICEILGPEAFNKVTEYEDLVDIICSNQSLTTEDGWDRCWNTCDEWLCCFLKGPENCYVDNEETCDWYHPCKLLMNTRNTQVGDNERNSLRG